MCVPNNKLTETLQEILYKTLQDFDAICVQNSVKYFLAYGTLLGAVRHKNFIPWDDDVDVFITRKEYEKLKSCFDYDRYELLDCDIDKNYPYLFPKIRVKGTELIEKNISDLEYNIGIYIDLFVLDDVPNGFVDFFKRKKYNLLYKLYRLRVLNLKEINYLLRPLAKVIKRIVTINSIVKKCNKVYCKQRKSNLVRDALMIKSKEYFEKRDFFDTVSSQFRESVFPINASYDKLLKQLYGNYMELPPLEQRVSCHNFINVKV